MNATKQREEITEIRKRHSQRQRKRIRMMKIRRTIFFTVLSLITVMVIMFYTPIFKIRSIDVEGTNIVQTDEILSSIGDAKGQNLFRAKVSSMKKSILKIPYVQSVEIDRRVLHTKLVVTITECEEAACIAGGSGYIIIDSNAKVLKDTPEKPENVPEITGLSIANISVGEQLKIGDVDKFNIILTCLDEMKKIDILKGVKSISVADITNITFNYEDRIDALCGSSIDLPKKLGFFKSAVNSSSLTENSRGTLDLTTVGKAIYTP